jgi:hypothetical protein
MFGVCGDAVKTRQRRLDSFNSRGNNVMRRIETGRRGLLLVFKLECGPAEFI